MLVQFPDLTLQTFQFLQTSNYSHIYEVSKLLAGSLANLPGQLIRHQREMLSGLFLPLPMYSSVLLFWFLRQV